MDLYRFTNTVNQPASAGGSNTKQREKQTVEPRLHPSHPRIGLLRIVFQTTRLRAMSHIVMPGSPSVSWLAIFNFRFTLPATP